MDGGSLADVLHAAQLTGSGPLSEMVLGKLAARVLAGVRADACMQPKPHIRDHAAEAVQRRIACAWLTARTAPALPHFSLTAQLSA